MLGVTASRRSLLVTRRRVPDVQTQRMFKAVSTPHTVAGGGGAGCPLPNNPATDCALRASILGRVRKNQFFINVLSRVPVTGTLATTAPMPSPPVIG